MNEPGSLPSELHEAQTRVPASAAASEATTAWVSRSRPEGTSDRKHGALALLIFAAVLALGLLLGRYHELGGYLVENDYYGQYYPAARAILDGQPMMNPRSGPGYPLLLAGGTLLGFDTFTFGKAVASVALAAAGWFTFLTVRALTGAAAGLVAQLFVYAILFRYGVIVGNDLPFVALATAALHFLLRRARPRAVDLLAAGALAGLAMSLRYPGVALLPPVLAALWLWPAPGTTFGHRLRASLLFALPALAGSAPSWAAPQLGLSQGKESKAYAFVALDVYADPQDRLSQTHLDEMEVRFTSMWDVLSRDPRRVVAHYAVDFVDDAVQMARDSVTLPAVFFVGAGLLLWFATGSADRRRASSYLLFPLTTFGIVALVPYQARYGYPLVPAAAALLATALVHPWARADGGPREARLARRVRALCLGLCFLPPIAMSAVKLREYLTTEPIELLEGAAALRPLVRQGDAMIARKAHLPHLVGAVARFPKQNVDLDGFLAWAREEVRARFLLVGEWEGRTNGALRPLIAGDPPPGLRLVWRHASPPHSVYEIVPP